MSDEATRNTERTDPGFFTAEEPLTPDAFYALAQARGLTPFTARKTAPIAAKRLNRETRVETRWNGAETEKTAEPGDWLVTALDANGAPLRDAAGALNQYAVGDSGFHDRYRPGEAGGLALTPWGRVYIPDTAVTALFLEDGFEIAAPWGERQRADRGYLILSRGKVYGNHADTFEATYNKACNKA